MQQSVSINDTIRGAGLLNSAINALPFELHIPGYQFCGSGTRLRERLARGERGINPLNAACREHDIAYSRNKELFNRHIADQILAKKARERITASDASFGERAAATAVWAAMKAKTKFGMGMRRGKKKTKRRKKRALPVAKRGGLLPLLPLLGALGSLVGGAAGVAKAVNDSKAARRQLEEIQRHNRAIEGRGLYLAPYKRSGGGHVKKNKKKVAKTLDLPSGVTTNLQLHQLAKRMQIPHFRGVFMRNALPREVRRDECGIVNLDDAMRSGTH